MAALDFVVSHPSAPSLNALPAAVRTVTLHVPDSLDPYHHQQLRDALEDEFRRGCQALAEVGSENSEGSNELLDGFASRMAALQNSLELTAELWLAKWSGSNQPSSALPVDDRVFIVQADQEIHDVLALVEHARSFSAESNHSEASVRGLENELDAQLARLSERLEAVLELPANDELEIASREALIQRMLETIQAGHAVATKIQLPR